MSRRYARNIYLALASSLLSLLACPGFLSDAMAAERGLPRPLASHPGNIFLAGEPVVVPLPPGENGKWRAVDYDGKTVAQGEDEHG